MTSGIRVRARAEARRYCSTSGTSPRGGNDERLEALLHQMTVEELGRLRGALHETLRTAKPANVVASESDRDDEALDVMMLLGAVAVAIAWWTHRAQAAPQQSIQDGMDAVAGGHPYMVPIPRHDPCFCGSQATYRRCHGQPPNALPKMAGTLR